MMCLIVEQHRWRPITPLSPSRHGRKHLAGQLHEMLTTHHVDRVFEVDLEEAKSGTLVLVEGVAE